MPFTPFHMGPGLAVKAVAGDSVSLIAFGMAQIAMDIEPLIHLLRGDEEVHGWTHTYAIATLVGLAIWKLGHPLAAWLLRTWQALLRRLHLPRLAGAASISQRAMACGALLGCYSHVLLDSLMHHDIRPLRPFSDNNALGGLISAVDLYRLCVLAGLLGLMLFLGVALLRKPAAVSNSDSGSH